VRSRLRGGEWWVFSSLLVVSDFAPLFTTCGERFRSTWPAEWSESLHLAADGRRAAASQKGVFSRAKRGLPVFWRRRLASGTGFAEGGGATLGCGYPDFPQVFVTVMNHTKHITASLALAAALVAGAHVVAPRPLHGQTTITLDGTSGSETISTNYTLSDSTTIDLGFFVEYLIVGGGGGGARNKGGGGGGGAVVGGTAQVLSSPSTVTVGAGGAGGSTSTVNANGLAGQASSAFGVTASGGQGGISGSWTGGASGNGNAGGAGTGVTYSTGGGGGGAGQVGFNGATDRGGRGGDGLDSSITGTSAFYGGGGGGGANNNFNSSGGVGGGAQGASAAVKGYAGTNGLGGGGGGGGNLLDGGAGGSGRVIVRYAGEAAATGGAVTAGTGSATGYTLHTFTTTGSSSFNLMNMSQRLGATLTGGISGSGNLTYSGPGRLTLAADSTYVGDTTISAGTLQVGSGGNAGSLGTGPVSIAAGSTLAFNRSDTIVAPSGISGSGTLDRLRLRVRRHQHPAPQLPGQPRAGHGHADLRDGHRRARAGHARPAALRRRRPGRNRLAAAGGLSAPDAAQRPLPHSDRSLMILTQFPIPITFVVCFPGSQPACP
jgi:hypothetical protein